MPPRLRPGALIGRYVVLDWLGAGGMGVVYAAFDPELDRKIALKLLPTDAAALVAREARAMARLAHPNVVSVFDVGAFADGVFITMELVEGETLRRWTKTKTRALDEVLDVFVQAGHGLAAAHAAGIVHRDFKPENVLLGRDGRVRVGDFGLARADLPHPSASALIATDVTLDAGTPAYMAPEQKAGAIPDPRSDQYAFCVALYEALHGSRPGDAALGKDERRIPQRVRDVLARGLARADDRFRSMDELLAVLAPRRSARWSLAFAGACIGAAIVSAAFTSVRRSAAHGSSLCRGGDALIARAWGAEQRGAIERAFTSTHSAYAGDAARATARVLDEYARAWGKTYVDACEATQVRGDQSTALLDRRMACLDDRKKELASLLELYASADAAVVTNAVRAAESLTPVDRCSDVRALTSNVLEPDARRAPEVRAVHADLNRAELMIAAGRYEPATPIVTSVTDRAHALGFAPLEAEALVAQGFLEQSRGDLRAGEATYRRAVVTADAAGDDRTRARATIKLLHSVTVLNANHAEIAPLRDQAAAAITRLGGDERLEARLLGEVGNAQLVASDVDAAVATLQRALELRERIDGPQSTGVANVLYDLAQAELVRGRYDRAEPLHERALSVAIGALGPTHDLVGTIQSGIAALRRDQGRAREAETAAREALAIHERNLGADHVNVAADLALIGAVLVDQGRFGEAMAPLQRAMAIFDLRVRPDHPRRFWALRPLGSAYLGLGNAARAIETLELALRLESRTEVARAEAEFELARALTMAHLTPGRARSLAMHAGEIMKREASCPLETALRDAIAAWVGQRSRA